MTEIILSNYVDACNTIAREFCDHMGYNYDDGYWVAPTYPPHIFDISSEFWSIEDMYMTLEYNIPPHIVLKRYRLRTENNLKTNLYHYAVLGQSNNTQKPSRRNHGEY